MRLTSTLFLALLLPLLGACSEPDKPSVALYLAVQRGDIDQLERHIHWGSDINAILPDGRYPLHAAAEKGEIVMVKILLKHGANIEQTTVGGDTAIELAILSGRTQLADVLLEQGARLDASSLLLKAATAGITDRDSLRFLIERGADTEQRNEDGDTALLIAVRQDNHRLATHLVNRGANVNVKAADGRSALALARELQLPELISLLQRQGAV